jgi:hypothetical protein
VGVRHEDPFFLEFRVSGIKVVDCGFRGFGVQGWGSGARVQGRNLEELGAVEASDQDVVPLLGSGPRSGFGSVYTEQPRGAVMRKKGFNAHSLSG